MHVVKRHICKERKRLASWRGGEVLVDERFETSLLSHRKLNTTHTDQERNKKTRRGERRGHTPSACAFRRVLPAWSLAFCSTQCQPSDKPRAFCMPPHKNSCTKQGGPARLLLGRPRGLSYSFSPSPCARPGKQKNRPPPLGWLGNLLGNQQKILPFCTSCYVVQHPSIPYIQFSVNSKILPKEAGRSS